MDILWAPWRMKFIRQSICKKSEKCIFCEKVKDKNDKKNLVLYRGKKCFVILNLYPYNNGHLMVLPYRHVKEIKDLDNEELLEMFILVSQMIEILKYTHKPEGFNIGINLGKVSGAGIEEHLHIHIVPRWSGDTNFMPVIGKTKVISESLKDTYNILLKEVKKIDTQM